MDIARVYLIRRQQWHNKSWRLQSHLPYSFSSLVSYFISLNLKPASTCASSNAFLIIFNHVTSFIHCHVHLFMCRVVRRIILYYRCVFLFGK